MADNKQPKTLKDLAIATGFGKSEKDLAKKLYNISVDDMKNILKTANKITKAEKERLSILGDLYKLLKSQDNLYSSATEKAAESKAEYKKVVGIVTEELKKTKEGLKILEKKNKELGKTRSLYSQINALLSQGVKYNQEMFRIGQEMQLQANVTWKEYRVLFKEAYEQARQANREIGQHVHNSKELIKMQNELLKAGYKDIGPETLASLATATTTMAKTIAGFGGTFPAELLEAFQLSYRQFGDQTDKFITDIGNRLNAFSKTFGTSIGMFSGLVSQMAASTSFLYRNNMSVQIQANESLMAAAALAGQVGLTSTNFISSLAGLTQFGTASQMATLHQGGALLQDFSVEDFQKDMISGNADNAILGLFDSIQKTIGGIDNHYLRAEYIDKISSAFGLSRDDILKITTQGDKLNEYSDNIQNKLLNVNTSMVDELKDYKMTWKDTIDNYFANSPLNETIGTVFQEAGLYGIGTQLNVITGLISAILYKNVFPEGMFKGFGGGSVSGLSGSKIAASKIGLIPKIGTVGNIAGGLVVGIGGNMAANYLGSSATNTGVSDSGANWRYAGNILGGTAAGAAGGAMIGSVVPVIGTAAGAIIGGAAGAISSGINVNKAQQERAYNIRASEIELRNERAYNAFKQGSLADAYTKTGNEMVDAIYDMGSKLIDTISGASKEEIKAQLTIATKDKNSALITTNR